MTDHESHRHDPECAVAHGEAAPPPSDDRVLVAVYASPMAATLLDWGRQLGFRTVLVEPDPGRAAGISADVVHHRPTDVEVGDDTDVVVTDHHRDDLGAMMAPLVRRRPRWIGILGSPRHVGPHEAALRAEGVEDELVATVVRPIGLDIGSKTPQEIALATLAGLLADRNGRDGGFHGARQPATTA